MQKVTNVEKYKDLVADLQEYQQYMPLLKGYFTMDVEQMKIRDELIKLLSCKTDEEVARNMHYTTGAFRKGGYTWQFNKRALKEYFDVVLVDAQKQQNWTVKQWQTMALKAARMLEKQQENIAQERRNVTEAVAVAGYAAERGADKARPTAGDTKSRLRDFGAATRKLQNKSKAITSADINKLQVILNGKRTKDYTE